MSSSGQRSNQQVEAPSSAEASALHTRKISMDEVKALCANKRPRCDDDGENGAGTALAGPPVDESHDPNRMERPRVLTLRPRRLPTESRLAEAPTRLALSAHLKTSQPTRNSHHEGPAPPTEEIVARAEQNPSSVKPPPSQPLMACLSDDGGSAVTERSAAAASPGPSPLARAAPRICAAFRRHRPMMIACYNICSFAVPRLSLGWVVHSTAMTYCHRFILSHFSAFGSSPVGSAVLRRLDGTVGRRLVRVPRMDPVRLAAAAVFLASKAENFKIRLSDLVRCIFECGPDHDDHLLYKKDVIDVEMALLATLEGDLTVIHPFADLLELATAADQTHAQGTGRKASKLYSYTTMTPVALLVDRRQLALALCHLAGSATGSSEKGATLPSLHGEVLREDSLFAVKAALVEALRATRKRADVALLDDAVRV